MYLICKTETPLRPVTSCCQTEFSNTTSTGC